MKVLEHSLNRLELDVYPHRISIIVISMTFTIAAVVGYFAFVK
ncbi:hypothetical protein [Sporosarcina sp. FSL K6-1508]